MSGRCGHCGQRLPAWTPTQIVEAIQAWHARTGNAPKAIEWKNGTPDHPSDSAVRHAFGTWNGGLRAAGFWPRGSNGTRKWTRPEAEQALFEWVLRNGRQPTWDDWLVTTLEHPSTRAVSSMYGSWGAFLVAAGYKPGRFKRSREGYERQAGAALRQRDELGRLVAS